MAEIISQEEIQAVSDLVREFNKLGLSIEEIIELGKDNKTAINQAKTVDELAKKIDKLEGEQKKLVDTNTKLKDAQEKAAKSTKNQAEAMDALDNNMGGVIGRAKQMGKEFLALMRNPFILALATIVAALGAMAHAMKTFVTTTGEGEDALNRQKGVFNQFFNVIKKGWSDLGKSFVEALGEDGLQGLLFAVLNFFSPKLAASFLKTSGEAKQLADVIDDIETRMAINITKRAETELRYNKLSLAAEKLKYTDQVKAVELLEAGIKVKEQQMRIDKELAKQQADATLYQIGLEHNLTKAEVDRMSHAERDAEFTGEEMKKIAEAYANVINLEAAYEQEVKRNTAKIIAFKEQIRKDIVDKAQKAAEKEIQESNNIVDAQIAHIKNRAVAGSISVAEAEKQILEVRKNQADDLVASQIFALGKILLVEQLTADERAAIEQKLFELKNKLVDEYYNQIEEKTKLSLEDIVAIYMDFSNSLGDLFSSLSERRIAEIDAEEKRMEERYAKEIELAGENEETKAILEKEAEKRHEEFEKRRITAQRRAAIFDKAVSASQAGVATALAIIKMLANPGGPAGVALSIAAGITGALQVAAILAKPIPQYKDGGFTIADWIIAGEEGTERFRTPGGQVGFTPDGPTLMKLPVGTEITPHKETMQDLVADSINNVGGRQATDEEINFAMLHKLTSLENTIRNKKEVHMNWTRKGLERAVKNGESRTYFENEFYR